MKKIFVSFCLLIANHCFSQNVTYKNIVGTSWEMLDTTIALKMNFTFIDYKTINQKSWAARYQPNMETNISYFLDTANTPTILNVEWKGEVMNCTKCFISFSDDHLIIENIGGNNIPDKLSKKLIFTRKLSSIISN